MCLFYLLSLALWLQVFWVLPFILSDSAPLLSFPFPVLQLNPFFLLLPHVAISAYFLSISKKILPCVLALSPAADFTSIIKHFHGYLFLCSDYFSLILPITHICEPPAVYTFSSFIPSTTSDGPLHSLTISACLWNPCTFDANAERMFICISSIRQHVSCSFCGC